MTYGHGHALRLAHADGTYVRLLAQLARISVLVLDDWGLAPLGDQERRNMLEILDDRYDARATIITSQLAPKHWHEYIADPTLADAICDHVLHRAHRIESPRRVAAQGTAEGRDDDHVGAIPCRLTIAATMRRPAPRTDGTNHSAKGGTGAFGAARRYAPIMMARNG